MPANSFYKEKPHSEEGELPEHPLQGPHLHLWLPRGLGVFINEVIDSKWQARLEFWRLISK